MTTENEAEVPTVTIPTVSEQESFEGLLQICEEKGHLQRPPGLQEGDVPDGINDHATFM